MVLRVVTVLGTLLTLMNLMVHFPVTISENPLCGFLLLVEKLLPLGRQGSKVWYTRRSLSIERSKDSDDLEWMKLAMAGFLLFLL